MDSIVAHRRARPEVQARVASKVERAFGLEAESTRLLVAAKTAVEIAIEQGEAAALAFVMGGGPMPLLPEIGDWVAGSEVDHVGPFVNAWAAFNAWYRHVSGKTKDAEALEYVRTQPNVVRSSVLPMLDPQVNDTPDALTFRSAIASLHAALEAFRLKSRHGAKVSRNARGDYRTPPAIKPNDGGAVR